MRVKRLKGPSAATKDFEYKNVNILSALRAESFVFPKDFEGKNVKFSPRLARILLFF